MVSKIEDAVKDLMKHKLDTYFSQRVDKKDIEEVAERLFTLARSGENEDSLMKQLRQLSSDIAEKKFKGND